MDTFQSVVDKEMFTTFFYALDPMGLMVPDAFEVGDWQAEARGGYLN